MFFCVKDSVAAVKMESSCIGVVALRLLPMASAPEDAEGMALGSEEDVLRAGPLSVPGDGGGGVDLDCHMERKLSRMSAELAICPSWSANVPGLDAYV